MVKKPGFEAYSRHYNFFSVSAEEKWKKISQGDGGRRGSRNAGSVTGMDERILSRN
jgi:hypothetical protein